MFTNKEKKIICLLYSANKPLTTSGISSRLNVAWQTVKKYLTVLHNKGIVDGMRYGKSFYWWLQT